MLLAVGFVDAQNFDAADVHASPAGATKAGALLQGGFLPNGRLEFRAGTLLSLISTAWSIPEDRITGGPSWLDTDRFDVVAQGPPSSSRQAQLAMLRNLLTGRFDLSVQKEEKPASVFLLEIGKGGPPKKSESGDPECQRTNEENLLVLTCRHTTMASLAEKLPLIAPAYFGRPVVDRTGLTDAYDFRLQWVGRGQLPPGPDALANSLSIFSSIGKQLGLKLEPATAPAPFLAVAHANRVPAPNPPGTRDKLGAPPTEFDVVEVRPSAHGEQPDLKIRNGRIDAKAIPLRRMIEFAWNVEGDALKGGPRWLETEQFDIVAKTLPTESDDTLRVLARAMLARRFGLTVHDDRQPITVFALTAVKPKLRDADPSARSTCKRGIEDGNVAFACRNVTMAQFAERISQTAPGYLDHPVVDLTGLEKSYDFDLTFAPLARIANRGPAHAGGDAANGSVPGSADPSPDLTLFEAVERQLGLKLATRKVPMPVIVIDRVERKPTEN
jgi:uncharacterized protein (TIGR03435 family)